MKKILLSLSLLASSVLASDAATSLIVNPATNRNDFTGVVGFRFSSTNSSTVINYLGFIDQGGDGLSASHSVGLYLWNGSNYALERSITVAAGTGATLHNGYRWLSIPSITLANTGVTYWMITASVASGDGDGWGDEALSGVIGSTGTLDSAIGVLNLAPGAAGYYDYLNTSITTPNLYFGGETGFYSFYNAGNIATAIPEPAVSLVACFGACILLRRRR